MKLKIFKINNKYNLFFLFLITLSFIFLVYQDQYFFIDIIKILTLFSLILFPIILYKPYFKTNILVIPYLQFFVFFYFINYCMGFFFNQKYIFFDNSINSKVINILLLSTLALYVGYFLFNCFLKKKIFKISFFKLEHNNKHTILYISLIYLFIFYIFNFDHFSKYLIFFKNSFFYLLAVSLANYFTKTKCKINKILFLFLFLILLFIDASSSSIFTSIFIFSCFVFSLFFLEKKKIAIVFLLFLLFFGTIFQISKSFQRRLIIIDENNSSYAPILFIKSIYNVLNVIYNKDKENDFVTKINSQIDYKIKYKSEKDTLLYRIFHPLNVFSIVIKKTPEKVDFYYGKSYNGFIYKFFPRILVPSKPDEIFGNFWGKRYGHLSESDNVTSWNFPVLAEFYANFGTIACFIGMFFIGCFLRLISVPITNYKKDIEGSLISISVFFQFVYQEYNLTLILGNLYISLICILLITYIINKIFKH
jgi:hypothetical protein